MIIPLSPCRCLLSVCLGPHFQNNICTPETSGLVFFAFVGHGRGGSGPTLCHKLVHQNKPSQENYLLALGFFFLCFKYRKCLSKNKQAVFEIIKYLRGLWEDHQNKNRAVEEKLFLRNNPSIICSGAVDVGETPSSPRRCHCLLVSAASARRSPAMFAFHYGDEFIAATFFFFC